LLLLFLTGCGGAANPTGTTAIGANGDGSAASLERRDARMGDQFATLGSQDPTLPNRAHFHVWQITLDPSQRIRVRMSSQQVDSLMEVRGPNDFHLRNDDAAPGVLDSVIDFQPPGPGTYEIWTSTYGADETGDYALSIVTRDPNGVGVPLELGTDVTAVLGSDGMQEGLPGTWLRFEGTAGTIVRLRVTSTAFDTIARLVGPGGQTWINDDANDLGPNGDERSLDSTIIAALPQSGVYQLIVTPYGEGAGPFRVRSTARPPVVMDGDQRPAGLAGADGGGRLLGLYAGITAYENQARLYGCADDARLLGEAMREAHLQNASDQMVLPDGLATREGFLGGIRQMADMAGPEDVVLVFFSGHGQQTPDEEGGDEIDQLDETIVMFDGPLPDDQVIEALDAIQAGTVILALDSCHSGGFARDWVTQPGRVGLFSSHEDVLSDVGEPHQAGGYLSWHLRRGVLGEADSRPRDGVLHAGELTDYLHDGFVADHRLMNPLGDLSPAQHLVSRRGSVTWDQVLWVYPRNPDFSLPELPNTPLTSPPP